MTHRIQIAQTNHTKNENSILVQHLKEKLYLPKIAMIWIHLSKATPKKPSPESKALEYHTDPKYSFILKRKHSKCKIKLMNLFKEELCQARCAHCHELCGGSEPASFTTHLVHIDIEQKKITMECQSCEWTTVRRIGVSSRVV